MPSSPSRSAHLLHADEEQLDRAAIALRSGKAFVLAVCPPKLRPAALARLRSKVKGLAVPDPLEVSTAEEMFDALVEQVGRRDRVLSLSLGGDVMGALDALNLHREKTFKGAPVMLWLPDVGALMQMRERAPDAFSFRSTMVVVRGDGGPMPVANAGEPEAVALARRRLKRARLPLERAAAAQNLAEYLRIIGKIAEAEEVARAGLLELPTVTTDEERGRRGDLCRMLAAIEAMREDQSEQVYWLQRALAEIALIPLSYEVTQRALILSTYPGPFYGRGRSEAESALSLVRAYGLAPEVASEALRGIAAVAIATGDLRRARLVLSEEGVLAKYAPNPMNEAIGLATQGLIQRAAGRLSAAEELSRAAAATVAKEGGFLLMPLIGIVDSALDRGEIASAERAVVEGWPSTDTGVASLFLTVQIARAAANGQIVVCLQELRMKFREPLEASQRLALCHHIVVTANKANDAEALGPDDLSPILDAFELTYELLSLLEGVPWYRVSVLICQASILSLTSESRPSSIAHARRALDLARETYPDLLPETGRSLADNLLRASQPDEALAAIADVEPYAAQHGFLKERARLLADRVLALVQRGDPPTTIAPHLTALREALSATDSPRITAETLRDLAILLPTSSLTPDPLALAEEIHPLFVAMPMPAEDARCLELMGDVLLARGRPDEARRRYVTARARLERYGLGLRLPLLDKKLGALG